jgi:hypothetical protein
MKHRKFSSPQIAEAVFRGKKSPYSFEVYPLNIEFNPVPAVYIISRRKIDKYGRAHHQIVSVGQTESLAAEVKSPDDEKSRLAIEEDLKSAYALRQLRRPPEIKKPAFLKVDAPKTATKAEPRTKKAETRTTAKAEKPKSNPVGKTEKAKAKKTAPQAEAKKPSKTKTRNKIRQIKSETEGNRAEES